MSERDIDVAAPLLREFIYLDEVSLRSLLASQQGALTETITKLEGKADQAELAASMGASFGVASAQVSSRFQATRNEEQQVSRKAIVQSLFKEFRELKDIDDYLVRLNTGSKLAHLPTESMTRGTLIEIEVELVADPIFRFSTVMDELLDIAKDYPEMASAPGAADVMAQMGPMNRILQRLMVGLVPIRAKAVGLVVREEKEIQSIVSSEHAQGDDLVLEIVGVTDQRNYWQDVRRLLFSGNRFTMLCRIAQDDVRDHWSAVKAADVLAEIMPTFPAMLERVGEVNYAPPIDRIAVIGALRLRDAVRAAYQLSTKELAGEPMILKETILEAICSRFPKGATTAVDQRSALDAAIDEAERVCEKTLEDSVRGRLRTESRYQSGLQILGPQRTLGDLDAPASDPPEARALLETEIIAIYW